MFKYIIRIVKLILVLIYYSIIYYIKKLKNLFFINNSKKKIISGQLALITGGGGGLGRAIALELAKHKCNIVIADIDLNSAKNVVEEICNKFDIKAVAYKVDVTNIDEIKSLATNIERDLGPIDILINNAGLITKGPFLETSSDDIEKTIRVNLLSYILTTRQFLQTMIDRRQGHIVAVSSIAGLIGLPLGTIYSSTKFGVTGFMESLTYELNCYNYDFIKTTTIYPYFIETRKDLIEYLNKHDYLHYLPAFTPNYVAERIVESILKEDINVSIPFYIKYIHLYKNLQPTELNIQSIKMIFKNRY